METEQQHKLDALIGKRVIDTLGRPGGLHKVQVSTALGRPLPGERPYRRGCRFGQDCQQLLRGGRQRR